MIESPCIRNCCLDKKDVCMGCFRTLEEIKQWSASNDNKKQGILLAALERKDKKMQKD